jgi:hypothetical protein
MKWQAAILRVASERDRHIIDNARGEWPETGRFGESLHLPA